MIEDGEGRTKEVLEDQWCVEYYVKEGYSQEDAKKKCAATQRDNLRLLKGDAEPEPASDGLGIVDREVTPMERCISSRMDIYNEDVETATRTCVKMFNDPLYRHAFESGDAWQMGTALHKWSYNHDDFWEFARRRDREEKSSRNKHITEIIEEIRGDVNDPDRFLPDISLKERAERIYKMRQEGAAIKATRQVREEQLTVGSLYGKTKEQIIREQATDQRDYGKTREQILEEIRVQTDQEEKLKKLRRMKNEE